MKNPLKNENIFELGGSGTDRDLLLLTRKIQRLIGRLYSLKIITEKQEQDLIENLWDTYDEYVEMRIDRKILYDSGFMDQYKSKDGLSVCYPLGIVQKKLSEIRKERTQK